MAVELTKEQKIIKAAKLMSGYMLSCRVKNYHEWMDGMAEKISNFAAAVGTGQKCISTGDGFSLIPTEDNKW